LALRSLRGQRPWWSFRGSDICGNMGVGKAFRLFGVNKNQNPPRMASAGPGGMDPGGDPPGWHSMAAEGPPQGGRTKRRAGRFTAGPRSDEARDGAEVLRFRREVETWTSRKKKQNGSMFRESAGRPRRIYLGVRVGARCWASPGLLSQPSKFGWSDSMGFPSSSRFAMCICQSAHYRMRSQRGRAWFYLPSNFVGRGDRRGRSIRHFASVSPQDGKQREFDVLLRRGS